MNKEMSNKALIAKAYEAMAHAYVPYSGFPVGAALITEDGTLYTGCNIEVASYGATNCAERTAIFKAVSEGHRKISRIAIFSELEETFPCGICRQVLAEFSDKIEIIIGTEESYKVYAMTDLLPHSFTKAELDLHRRSK